ncbi:MAG: DUF3817 domain-containing protein [Bradyrhizobium sp.]|uniref:DUF3817 domain-containing protein n=1 Tax=Bradyrhizobium sp. TaxID=376 RepID=UPI001D438C40|nr:DUF3817 domain-containing protein [Bradyrhizobium sp.]MBV9561475.1 DUF3817 domain-containing protein [Bradyrhizobium sp.]
MPGRAVRLLAIAEALTLLTLIFIAVPLKHIGGIRQATTVLGPVHGLTFLAFCWAAVRAWSEGAIERRDVVRLVIGACLPFGGFVNERWLRRRLGQA